MPKIKRLIVVIVVVGAATGVTLWYTHRHESPAKILRIYGNVDIRQVDLAFTVSDRIDEMYVEEGQHVRKGQALAALDTTRFRQRVAKSKAQVAQQEQLVAALVAGSRPEEIREARANMQAAKAEAQNAERIARRQEDLVKRGLTSIETAEDARSGADAAAARFRSAREALALAVEGPRKEDIAAAKAQLQALRAQLALDEKDLADAVLVAPVDAVVENRILQPGDMAAPQTPVYTLSLMQPLWVRAYVEERDMGKLYPGMPAEVTTDSFPGKRYKAWVGFISPTAEFTPKTVETTDVRTSLVYQVRVFVCDSQNELRQGMPATVTLSLQKGAAVVPGCGPKGIGSPPSPSGEATH